MLIINNPLLSVSENPTVGSEMLLAEILTKYAGPGLAVFNPKIPGSSGFVRPDCLLWTPSTCVVIECKGLRGLQEGTLIVNQRSWVVEDFEGNEEPAQLYGKPDQTPIDQVDKYWPVIKNLIPDHEYFVRTVLLVSHQPGLDLNLYTTLSSPPEAHEDWIFLKKLGLDIILYSQDNSHSLTVLLDSINRPSNKAQWSIELLKQFFQKISEELPDDQALEEEGFKSKLQSTQNKQAHQKPKESPESKTEPAAVQITPTVTEPDDDYSSFDPNQYQTSAKITPLSPRGLVSQPKTTPQNNPQLNNLIPTNTQKSEQPQQTPQAPPPKTPSSNPLQPPPYIPPQEPMPGALDYQSYGQPQNRQPKKRKPKKSPVKAIAIASTTLIIVAVAGIGAYFFLNKPDQPSNQSSSIETSVAEPTTAESQNTQNSQSEQPINSNEKPIPVQSATATCTAKNSDPMNLFNTNPNSFWVCNRVLNIDGEILTIKLPSQFVVTSIKFIPGNNATINGVNQWDKFRIIDQVTWNVGYSRFNQDVTPSPNWVTTSFPPVTTQEIRLTINKSELPKGAKPTQQIAISKIEILGHKK